MYEKEIKAMILAAKNAEVKIKEIYNTDFQVEIKSDDSPVTSADKTADEYIRKVLKEQFPDHGFLTEESKDTKERLHFEDIFIVDPVDGTKEFVNRNGEFTTNIALAHNHQVVAGVINIPMQGVTYYATLGGGAFRLNQDGSVTEIHVSNKRDDLTVLVSRSFLTEKEEALIKKHSDLIKHTACFGAAIKFCRIAEGDAEISYRTSSNTKEWDVAAGDIILSEAGGVMLGPDGKRFTYNRENVYNVDGYTLANCLENVLL